VREVWELPARQAVLRQAQDLWLPEEALVREVWELGAHFPGPEAAGVVLAPPARQVLPVRWAVQEVLVLPAVPEVRALAVARALAVVRALEVALALLEVQPGGLFPGPAVLPVVHQPGSHPPPCEV
jgi:hypothetical protein